MLTGLRLSVCNYFVCSFVHPYVRPPPPLSLFVCLFVRIHVPLPSLFVNWYVRPPKLLSKATMLLETLGNGIGNMGIQNWKSALEIYIGIWHQKFTLEFGIGFGYWKMEIVLKILENGNIGYRQCKYWIVLDAILIVKQFLISILDPPELFIEPRVFFFNAIDLNINLFVRKYLGHFSNIFFSFQYICLRQYNFYSGP